MTPEKSVKPGFFTLLSRKLGFLGSAEHKQFVPTLDQLDEAARDLIGRSTQDHELRSRLLYFAGRTVDSREKIVTHADSEYGARVQIFVGDDTKAAVNIGISEGKNTSLMVDSRLALPGAWIIRKKPLAEITDATALGQALEDFIRSPITPEEITEFHKQSLHDLMNIPQSNPAVAPDWMSKKPPLKK